MSLLVTVVVGWAMTGAPTAARELDPGFPPGSLHAVPLPGGLRAAHEALGAPGAPDRSHFLLDLIRRHFQTPRRSDPGGARARATLVAHLERAAAAGRDGGQPFETVPLPLTPRIWIDAVFGGRATETSLVASILGSSDAALLYHGLLALDSETRAWLAERPPLVAIASQSAALFATAAPGLRVRDGVIELPGGAAATPAWEALVERSADAPEEFLRALVAPSRSRLAYLVWAMAQLSASQIAFVMRLDAEPMVRVATARRLLAIYERLGWEWRIEDRPFWRPPIDPALLAAELPVDDHGRPLLAGTQAFWEIVFADRAHARARPADDGYAREAAAGPPVGFIWLSEQIFQASTGPEERYHLVLFASRVLRDVTPETAGEALDALRTARAYPTLSSALERAGITDAAIFAAAGRRATDIARIRSRQVAHRTLAQFQGTLAILTRAAARSAEPSEAVGQTVLSLAAVDIDSRGDYQGRLVRWLDAHVRSAAGARLRGTPAPHAFDVDPDVSLDTLLRHAAAGTFTMPLGVVDWEGTRYRVDLAHGELVRIEQLLGAASRPYASAATSLVRIADALETPAGAERLAQHAATLEQVADEVGWGKRPPAFLAALRRHADRHDPQAAARLAPALRLAADELLGHALIEITYAVALGQPEGIPISAAEAAARHGFGLGTGDWRRMAAWQAPVERQDSDAGWRVSGSLLGLDVRLAPFSVLQLSSKPPPRRPTLNDQDRRAMMETIPLIAPAALLDGDRDTIVAAIRRGRARVGALGSAADAQALADEIRMSPAKRSLFAWAVVHDIDAVPSFLSAGDLLWLGLEGSADPDRLHRWGAPARSRVGCLCLRVTAARSEEMFWGRWHAGFRISAFPDLNLRLTELLADLQMPALLLAPVLAPAVFDFVNLVESPDPDDRRGLIEFVRTMHLDQVEQYLAALTTDGPLVPVSHTPESSTPTGTSRGGGEAP